MIALRTLKLVLTLTICIGVALSTNAEAGLFSLEIADRALEPGDEGTLRIVYEDGDENFSFFNGGLHLNLRSSTPGVIKFLDAEILNFDERWTIAIADQITDDQVGRLFAASIMTQGLAGTSPRTFAEIKYSLVGPGSTELLVDIGGEDPLVEGPLGEISALVNSRGLCLGECVTNAMPSEINLGDSWAQLKEQMYPPIKPNPPVYNEPEVPAPTTEPLPESVLPSVTEVVGDRANVPDNEVEVSVDSTSTEIETTPYPRQPIIDLINGKTGVRDVAAWSFYRPLILVEYSGFNLVSFDNDEWTRNGQLRELGEADSLQNFSTSLVAYDAAILPATSGFSSVSTQIRLSASNLDGMPSQIMVPEPQTLLLAGLLGLGFLSRRSRHTR